MGLGYSCLAPVCIQDIGPGAFYPSCYCPRYENQITVTIYFFVMYLFVNLFVFAWTWMDLYFYFVRYLYNIYCLFLYLLRFIFVFVVLFASLVFAGILYFVFGFCTMSGVRDGCSGDWVIGLSNHINEAAQEEGRSSKVFMGALSTIKARFIISIIVIRNMFIKSTMIIFVNDLHLC